MAQFLADLEKILDRLWRDGPAAARRKRKLTASLLAEPCPDGDGPAGRSCVYWSNEAVILGESTIAHPARILAAIRNGRVSRNDVAARFGTLPDWLT